MAGEWLFVADTNNHRIVRVDLKTDEWLELPVFSGERGMKPDAAGVGDGERASGS